MHTRLITGTSSGIGRATAKHFQAERLEGHRARCGRPRHRTSSRSSNGRWSRASVFRILSPFGLPSMPTSPDSGVSDALVNNAGYGAYGPLEARSPEKIRRQFDVNVLGLLATTQAVLPHFRGNRTGTIINVSSVGGRMAFPLGTLYHGTRFAVEGLSESVYYELGALGIRVKIVEPGGMTTDFGGRSLDFSNDTELKEYQPLVQKVLDVLGPMMANGSAPERIAEVIYSAATDGTDRLRYEAGANAVQMLVVRRSTDDAGFLAGMRARFGLGGHQ